MPRTVTEWVGKTDDSAPSDACKRRIVDRQDRRCALSGKQFAPGDTIQFDHVTPLWLGGANRESNLQAVLGEPHRRKTKAEAAVRSKVNNNTSRHLGIKTVPVQKIQSVKTISERTAKNLARERVPLPPRRSLYSEEIV